MKAVCLVEELGYVVALLVYDRDLIHRCDGEVDSEYDDYQVYRLELRISDAQSGNELLRLNPKTAAVYAPVCRPKRYVSDTVCLRAARNGC